MNRKETVKEILNNCRLGKSCVLIGESGVGKSYVLHQVKIGIFCCLPIKKMLESITGKKGTINELLILALNSKPKTVIFDDYENLNKTGRKIITELQRKGYIFVTSSLKEINDFESIKLERLNLNEALEGFKEFKIPKEKFKEIYEKSGGLAHYINKYCMEYKNGLKIEEMKPISFKRINLLSSKSFLSLATLLITVRYYLYMSKDFKTGYVVAFAAYLIYFLFRR